MLMKKVVAVALAVGVAAACQRDSDIRTASGEGPRPPTSSSGLGPLGGGNEPDAAPIPPGDLKPFPDAGSFPDAPPSMMEGEKCAGESQSAKQVPVDLLLLVDRSGSMTDRVGAMGAGKTKWELATEALTAFFKDSRSAGLGIGLQYFPLVQPCTADAECGFATVGTAPACAEEKACLGPGGLVPGDPVLCGARRERACGPGATCVPIGHCADTGAVCANPGQPCQGGLSSALCTAAPRACRDFVSPNCKVDDYQRLEVPIGDLPLAAAALSRSLAMTFPFGGTPTDPAVEAGLAELRARAAAHPDRHEALVLVTDGLPNSCRTGPVQVIEGLIGAARMATPSIPTYAIGVFSPIDLADGGAALTRWATAGGTGTPFVLSAGDDLNQKLIAALEQIRGQALPCEYTIPKPASGTLDYMKVNVHVNSGTTGADIGYVGKLEQCDPVKGGWYYDVDPATGTPTRVVMCEATCKKFKMDTKANIELRFGCQTVIIL